ncbi:MAG: lasso peptide biosynthesis B2 protein [Burkholderiaceae bacterium]|nr:lasso peptide biosynthesis B2 protein [Burkholderiaceae bacterium]
MESSTRPLTGSLGLLEWRYCLLSLLLLPLIDVSLRRSGLASTRRRLKRFSRSIALPSEVGKERASLAPRIARAVSIAGRRSLWPTSCLRQALLLQVLLARQGMDSQLRIGVRNSPDEGFGAHAWVERDGQVLIGGEHASQQYAALL